MTETYEIDVYVRFCETDAGGHINNSSYFLYMEEARTKFFEMAGFGPRNKSNFIVAQTACDFLAQAFAAQTLTIITTVSKIGSKSYTMVHEIKDAKTELLIAKGSAVVVCFNFETQQTIEIPVELRQVLKDYLTTGSVKESKASEFAGDRAKS